ELNADVEEVIELVQTRPMIAHLIVTTALEHYTAMMAADMLGRDDFLAASDPAWADLWRWHAIEEIEHKGVAYDTFLHATKDWSRWKRWRAKSLTMLLVTMRFWPRRVKGMKALLRQDGLSGWRVTARIWWFLAGKPGVLRRLIPAWIAYFMPGFHPWNRDDRALIGKVDSDFAEANRAGALAA
ncbi:MAG: metal-dependent hydrolase, partial [Sphingopyxis sp.]